MWKCGSGFFSFRKRWHPKHLDYIDKSHCNLTAVPDDIFRHERTLEELSLEANQIQDLPKPLFRLHKLRRLILADNEIQDLPSDLGNLIALEELDISKNDFRLIPDEIEKLKKLTYLDVSSNSLGEVPDSITKLPELQNWVVNDIALGEIPPEIGSLSKLVILELRDNCIKFLPMSFSFLSNLERLDLGGNELEELPDTIGQLHSLIELWLDNNMLMSLPAELGELKKLQCLDVSENHIAELPEEIGGLESLTDLILTKNTFHELPEGIGELKKLQILKIEENQMDELTGAIGGCISLLELILTENELEFLPGSIGKLSKLSHFNIDKNRLFTLPPEIGNCTRLSVLSARENDIATIPKEIGNCRSLTVLALSGNKLRSLPLTVSSLPLKALWLSQNQSQSVLKLQVEDDEKTLEKVLTCFLFPQEDLKGASLEDFVNDIYGPSDEKTWKTPDVKFADSSDENKVSHLERVLTPYPKELRSRHPNLVRKRSNSADSDKHEHEHTTSELRPLTPSDEVAKKKRNSLKFDESAIVVGADGGIDNPLLADIDNNDSNENIKENIKGKVTFNESAATVAEENSSHSNDEDNSEKRVGFVIADDLEDGNSFDDSYKWERKDTPHHLKGKRITSEDPDALQDILSKLSKKKSEEKLDHLDDEVPVKDEDAGKVFSNKGVSFENGEVETDYVVVEETGEEEKERTYKYKRRDTPRPADFKKEPFKPRVDVSNIFAEEEEEEETKGNDDKGGNDLGNDSDVDNKKENTEATDDEEDVIIEQKTITKVYEEITTVLERDGTSLGINIAGGMGMTTFDEDEEYAAGNTPDGYDEEEGVFITKITPNGPADKTGVLQLGDKIIKVNDADISTFAHDDAVTTMKEASSPVTIVVLREVTDEEQINDALMQREEKNVRFAAEPEVEDIEIAAETIPVMLKRDAKGLGFSIAGGKGATAYKSSNMYKGTDEGIYISKLSENGPAALDKRLQVGDKLLSINNVDVRNAKHDDVVNILTSCADKVTLVAYRERIVNKKMRPMSQINGNTEDVKTVGESTKAEGLPGDARQEPRLLVEEVILKKSAGPLGLSIVGGSDHASHPFGVNEPGIFVSKVNPTGEAAKTNLCVGDRILRVNDKDMQTATHHEAVAALITNDPVVKLLIRHDPPPPGIQEININKKLGEKLGISIRGGAKGHPGNPFDKEDEGIFVSKVNLNGAAARDARLKVGMRILEVNNTSLLGATHVDAVRALRTAGDNLSLIVCDGYDEDAAAALHPENILFNPLLCEPTRFSPDSQSSATSGDSFGDVMTERINYHDETDSSKPTQAIEVNQNDVDIYDIDEHGNKVKRTPSAAEQRAINAEKRAEWRKERMAALDNDAKKAQVVIAQAKALSTSSLEGSCVSDSEERTTSTS